MHSHTCIYVCTHTCTHACMHECKHRCTYERMQALLQAHMQIHMQARNTCMHTHTHTHAHTVGGKVLSPQHTLTVYMVPGSKPLITCSWDEAGVSVVLDWTLSALAVIRYRTFATSSNTSLGGNQVALSARVPKLTTERLTGGSGTADKQRQSDSSVPTCSKTCPCIQVCVHILYITYTLVHTTIYTLQFTAAHAVAGLAKRVVYTISDNILFCFVLFNLILFERLYHSMESS